jgi:hypothetical protein
MIHEMEATLDKLAADIEAVDSTYTSARARNYISFSDDSTGFADQIGLVHSLLYSFLILIALWVFVLLWKIHSDKEKEV